MREKLLIMSDNEIRDFVRERLQFKTKNIGCHLRHVDIVNFLETEHLRFDMSGYGVDNSCYFQNMKILKKFRDCGIWDYCRFLYLDAYKGSMTLYFRWWRDNDNHSNTGVNINKDYTCWGTVEIIRDIITRFYIVPAKNNWQSRRF